MLIDLHLVNPCYEKYTTGNFLSGFTEQAYNPNSGSLLQFDAINNKITIAVKIGNTADILIQPILPDCPLSGISFSNLPSFVLPYVNAINGNQYLSINGQ